MENVTGLLRLPTASVAVRDSRSPTAPAIFTLNEPLPAAVVVTEALLAVLVICTRAPASVAPLWP